MKQRSRILLALFLLLTASIGSYAKENDASGLNFDQSTVTVSLIDLVGTVQQPTGTSTGLTYTSSDENVAKVDGTTLRYINTGTTTITATDGTNSAQYTLNVVAGDAGFNISGNTFSVTNSGILNGHDYQVPGMSITIGNGTNAVIVKPASDNATLGTLVIDENGFTHVWPAADNTPYEGTFYKFTATMSGTLSISGYSESAGMMLWRDGTAGTSETKRISRGNNTLGNILVTKGHTYYLYEDITASTRNYCTLMLTSFTFNPTFKLNASFAVTTNGATSYTYTDILSGISGNTTVTATCKGNVASANVTLTNGTANGQRSLSISNITYGSGADKGGAIVVNTASDNGSGVFVLTIPYNTNEWNFTGLDYRQLESNTTDWLLTYQVRNYRQTTDNNGNTVRTLYYLNAPVMSSATAVDGTNAYYIDQTAGLVIKSGAARWGALATVPGEEGKSITDRLNTPYTNVTGVDELTIYNGSSITIPNLKQGQYVRVKWLRHADNSGNFMTATNLTDLEGKAITDGFGIGALNNFLGYEEFRVAADGDVTFTLAQDGWTNILNITVGNDFLDTDMRLYNPINTTVKTRGDEETQVNYDGSWGNNWTTSAMTTQFSIKDGSVSSTLNASITTDGVLTVSGHGYLTIVQKAYTHGYMLDTEETSITVNNERDVSQNYPYTWDFTKINEDTKNNLAADVNAANPLWTKVSDNTYGLIVSNTNFSQGNDLTANDVDLAEFDGLGFRTFDNGKSYDGTILVNTDGSGLNFVHSGGNRPATLIIPSVPKGYYVYIRCHRNVGMTNTYGVFTSSGGGDLETIHTGGGGNGSEDWIYRIAGTGANITLSVREYTIYKIGITATFKNFNAYQGNSYITEYRDHNEKYDLSGYFTYDASPVTGMYVSEVNDGRSMATTTDVAVAPARTGVILKCASTTDNKNVPLFVTDVNTPEDDVIGNMLNGVLASTYIGSSSTNGNGDACTNYIFTRVFYRLDDSGNIVEGTRNDNGTLGFYRIAADDNSNLAANKAYLQVPDGDNAGSQTFYLISALFSQPTTGINAPVHYELDKPATYYTLSGQRLSGKPEQKGVYIVNGKKELIK